MEPTSQPQVINPNFHIYSPSAFFPGFLAILLAVAALSRLPVAVFGDDDLSRASHSSDLWLDDVP